MLKKSIAFFSLSTIVMLVSLPLFAAKPVDLSEEQPGTLRAFLAHTQLTGAPQYDLKTGKSSIDINGVTHTRFKQVYGGIEVLSADGIIHSKLAQPSTSLHTMSRSSAHSLKMQGIVYTDLANDLGPAPKAATKDAASLAAKAYYQSKTHDQRVINLRSIKPVIYLEKIAGSDPKAHWAYEVALNVIPTPHHTRLTRPTYVIDAMTKKVYEEWDGIQTIDHVSLGGVGGNPKMGKIVYGATQKHIPGAVSYLPALDITRFSGDRINFCVAENEDTIVNDFRDGGGIIGDILLPGKTVSFNCQVKDPFSLGIFWNEQWSRQKDSVNEGYAPTNDALYVGKVVNDMYQEWYGEPVLQNEDGSKMQLRMIVHFPDANAYWDGEKMIYGDGIFYDPSTDTRYNLFYPLTSLDVGAHEISHGFTNQHADLIPNAGQPGAINESFSDMAAQAAEFYAEGKSSWKIGHKITRELINNGGPLRYIDHPEKDDHSINHVRDFKIGMDVHYSAGVFNRLFYLIATDNERNPTGTKQAQGFDTKKAFDIMVEANKHYWDRYSSFEEAACGVLKATRAYATRYPGDYQIDTVIAAMKKVGLMNRPRKVAKCLADTVV